MNKNAFAMVLFLQVLIDNNVCKENYIILPKSLKFCKDSSNIRDLTITKQISLSFNGTESLKKFNKTKSLQYVCEVIVKPLGRHISITYNEGFVNFWMLRLKMAYNLDCKSTLTLQFLNEDRNYVPENALHISNTDEKTVTQVYGCSSDSPIIMNANNRKLSISWHTDDLNSLHSQFISIELSTYMNFEGNFTLKQKERNCILQYGYWCGPSVQVCINAQMRCDEADSCFDGGSDEDGCPPPRNVSHHRLNSRPQKNGWTSYISWIVIGALPLILLFALVLICSQRRHGLDSFPSDVEEDTFRNPDGLDEICNKHVEKRENNCCDLVGGTEGFSICYGGRIHHLSGDPHDSGSMESVDSTNQWNSTGQYLPQESPGSSSVIEVNHNRQETHCNYVDLDEGALNERPLLGVNSDMKPPKMVCRKIAECPGEISPTLTNGSSINDASPTRVKSQISVLTYCGSERSGAGLVRSTSVEDDDGILMQELQSVDVGDVVPLGNSHHHRHHHQHDHAC